MSLPTTLSASVSVSFNWRVSADINGIASQIQAGGNSYGPTAASWDYGTGANQANAVLYAYGSFPGGSTVVIDLFNVNSPDSNLNNSFAFSLVKWIGIELLPNPDDSASASGIRIGNNGTTPWQGWLSAGATNDLGGGSNSAPYLAGDDTGKVVDASARYLLLTNLDSVNFATIRLTIIGIGA